MPNGLESIGAGAFQKCENLTNNNLPNSLVRIGGGSFYGCKYLTNITLPNSVTKIETLAFDGCTNLISVTIGSSVSSCSSITMIKRMTSREAMPRLILYKGISLSYERWNRIYLDVYLPKIPYDIYLSGASFGNIYYDGTKKEWKKARKTLKDFLKNFRGKIYCSDAVLMV